MAENTLIEVEREEENTVWKVKMPAAEKKAIQELLKKLKRREKRERGETPPNYIIIKTALQFYLENKKRIEEEEVLSEEAKKLEAEIESLKEVLPGYLKNKIAVIKSEGYIKVIADRKALGKWYSALKLVLKELGYQYDWNSFSWVKPVTMSEEEINRRFNFKRPDNLPERKFTPRRKEKEEMVLGWKIVRGRDGLLWAVKDGEWRPLNMEYFEFNAIKAKIESWENRTRYIY